ncbi:3-mercaptopyruvate sulfurtransferase [Tunturiibacter gelidoferens]|uniref:Thiosulfate/3-mercaptopyruvate sulfurtransferase n=1 Tax=Tunturiibacter gelidiferens TaxID=3069689 RepID=A0ACC5NY64_9BACT|nr:3-mercaptopyruvate sulfurtransferase [Edaphobacter lichenicola]MBB5339542.1 thiosulfate/3-mercaptopyruvate sulfurtransferase [Edaphobacter lichenicola]
MNLLVTPAWLAARLQSPDNNPDTIILDATLPPVGVTAPIDTHARYLAQHIPGAIFFDIEDLSDHTTPLPHMLPTAEAFSRSMSSLGIANNATIVIYEQESVFSAPRAWWMLRTMGAENVHILDGGLRAWIEASLPTESGPVHHAPATFHATLNHDAVKNLAQLKAELSANQKQILDARSTARFNGTAPEPRPNLSSGHMPGATSIPFTELVEDGRLKPADKLRELFAAKKIDLHQPITTSCGSGVTAAVIALGLELAGAKDVSLYDGSWAEYAQQPDSIIEKD